MAVTNDVKTISRPLNGPDDLDSLIERIGESRYVLLGEASHGTHEYYAWRAAISKRLIEEKGFSFVAVEGDWPDCYRVNRYVKGYKDAGRSARDVLHAFNRWPTWMWANREVVEFAEWLRAHNRNEGLSVDRQVGFYGLDVYSLWDSLYAVIKHVKEHDPQALDAAYRAWQCFEPYGEEAQEYARATMMLPESCEQEVISMLKAIRAGQPSYPHDGNDEQLNVEQNALVVRDAEAYYRIMVRGDAASWNLRDAHMTQTLIRLMELYGEKAKGIVWAHNTHIGDARYTDMGRAGEYNIGQLVRAEHGQEGVFLLGFGSFRGTVIAAREWDSPMQKMQVPPAVRGSYERQLHDTFGRDTLLLFGEDEVSREKQLRPVGHRAIGVVYHPEYEMGNYVPSVIPKRYDAFCYLDTTRALSPLHMKTEPDQDLPETYPWAV